MFFALTIYKNQGGAYFYLHKKSVNIKYSENTLMAPFTDLSRKKSKGPAEEPLRIGQKKKGGHYEPVITSLACPKFIEPSTGLRQAQPGHEGARSLAIFLTFGLIIVTALNLLWIYHRGIELKDKVALATKSGFEKLLVAGNSFNDAGPKTVMTFFEEAKRDFDSIQKELWFLQESRSTVRQKAGQTAVFEAGKLLAEAGMIMTQISENLQALPRLFLEYSPQAPSLTELLKKEIPLFQNAAKLVREASEKFNSIPIHLVPREFQPTFVKGKQKLSDLSQSLARVETFLPAILNLLGDKRPHRFLILSQNRYETRPTGGFVGSYILATLNDGYLTEFEPHDTYASDYQLKEVIPPPEEFRPLLSRWFMRDCNYHPRFEVSGERCAWFLQKEAGPSVDSVIAIDQTIVEDLLRITGPIYFEPFKQFITADNFSFIFSYVTEAKLAGRDDPKKLLRDFISQFQKEILQKADLGSMAAVFKKAVAEKHLMAYSRETGVEAFFDFATRNESPMLKPGTNNNSLDYIHIVNYSIGGNKSDEFLKQKITHETFFMPDGSIEDEVTIRKTHLWTPEIEKKQNQLLSSFGFESLNDKLRWILGQGNNFAAMRIYVPPGSELLHVDGSKGTFEVTPKEDPEFSTYFSTKMDVKAGETVTLKIRYRLPWKFIANPTATYKFLFQKQAGVSEVEFEKHIAAAAPLTLLRSLPSPEEKTEDRVTYRKKLRQDFNLATLWK